MILTVNIGNTHITVGGYINGSLCFCGRLHSNLAMTADEYALHLSGLFTLHHHTPDEMEGAILGSVVPVLNHRLSEALRMLSPVRVMTVGPGLKSGLKLRLDTPSQLGAELLCSAVAALSEGIVPLVAISADTAIAMVAVNSDRELVGGLILPGPQLALNGLIQNTAQLPQIDLSAPASPSLLGKNTPACIHSGIIRGTAAMLDGLSEQFRAELGADTHFYITGNLPSSILQSCRTPLLYRETLILDGLYLIWQRNRK